MCMCVLSVGVWMCAFGHFCYLLILLYPYLRTFVCIRTILPYEYSIYATVYHCAHIYITLYICFSKCVHINVHLKIILIYAILLQQFILSVECVEEFLNEKLFKLLALSHCNTSVFDSAAIWYDRCCSTLATLYLFLCMYVYVMYVCYIWL